MQAHRQEYVRQIHEHHEETSNPSVVIEVASEHEGNCDEVMGHHLPVVLTMGLRVEDEDLVAVKCALCEIIKLEGSCKGYMGIIYPDGYGVQKFGWEIEVNPLIAVSARRERPK